VTLSGLEVETADLLPVLGEEGSKVVDSEGDVLLDLLRSHANVSNGNTEADGLGALESELDGAADLFNLVLNVVVGVKAGGELTSLGETRTEDTGKHTGDSSRSEESVVAVSKSLDLLLVLVEELEVIHGHGLNANSLSLSVVDIVTDHADLEARARNVGEDDGTGETLLLVGVVGLESDLELDRLDVLALAALGLCEDLGNSVLEGFAGELAVGGEGRGRRRRRRGGSEIEFVSSEGEAHQAH